MLKADFDHAGRTRTRDRKSLVEHLHAKLSAVAVKELFHGNELRRRLAGALALGTRCRLGASRGLGNGFEHTRIVEQHNLLRNIRLIVVHSRCFRHVLRQNGVELRIDLHIRSGGVLHRSKQIRRDTENDAEAKTRQHADPPAILQSILDKHKWIGCSGDRGNRRRGHG